MGLEWPLVTLFWYCRLPTSGGGSTVGIALHGHKSENLEAGAYL